MPADSVTKEEDWRRLLVLAQQQDAGAKERVIQENMGLVYMVVKRFAGRGVETEDLVQIGCVGLLKAVDRFDVTTPYSFSTYAVPLIIGEIKRFLRDDGIVHLSRSVREHAAQIEAERSRFVQENAREPDLEELSKATGMDKETIVSAMMAFCEVDSIHRVLSETADGRGDGVTLEERLANERNEEEEIINTMTVQQLLNDLGEKERSLIELRYMQGKTQFETAKRLGMNQVAVSRLEKKILLQLRSAF